ncbi:MAG TPA: hypothetical protein VG328_04285 [Stellaceae bacterium]|jgi:hypothetical protein|nr:hypothetical protein [Stellaceae bacterium]
MNRERVKKTWPQTPGYDNPSRNKGDLYDEAKGHPQGREHVGKQGAAGQHEQRPKPDEPVGHSSDKKLGQKPPARRAPLDEGH